MSVVVELGWEPASSGICFLIHSRLPLDGVGGREVCVWTGEAGAVRRCYGDDDGDELGLHQDAGLAFIAAFKFFYCPHHGDPIGGR